MAVTIEGIPAMISRADYRRLIESVGFNLNDVMALTFHVNSIEATVIARNAEGRVYIKGETDDIAVHNISIPVED